MVDMSNLGRAAQLVGRKKRGQSRILTAHRRVRWPGMAGFPQKKPESKYSDGPKADLPTKGPARPVSRDMLAAECAPHMGVGATCDRLRRRKIANLRPLKTTKPPTREGGNTSCYTYMRLTRSPPIRENRRRRKSTGRPAIGDSGDRRGRRPPVSESRPDLTPRALNRRPGGVKRPREMRGRASGRLAPVRWADSPALRLCARRNRRPDLAGRRAYRRAARQPVGEYMAARVPSPRRPYPRAKGGGVPCQAKIKPWRTSCLAL